MVANVCKETYSKSDKKDGVKMATYVKKYPINKKGNAERERETLRVKPIHAYMLHKKTILFNFRTSVSLIKAVLAVLTVWGLAALFTVASMSGGFEPGFVCTLLVVLPQRGLHIFSYVLLTSVASTVFLYLYIGKYCMHYLLNQT